MPKNLQNKAPYDPADYLVTIGGFICTGFVDAEALKPTLPPIEVTIRRDSSSEQVLLSALQRGSWETFEGFAEPCLARVVEARLVPNGMAFMLERKPHE